MIKIDKCRNGDSTCMYKKQEIVLSSGWRTNKDLDKRQKIILNIVKILHKRKPNATQECLEKIPKMARRFEEILYKSASSKDTYDTYHDDRTLKQRLRQVAVDVKKKHDTKNSSISSQCQKSSHRFKLKSFRRRKFDTQVLCKIEEEL
uniref:Mediator complex subunit 15 KIX domain-containing protein n=1 Tax=Eucampia antarctica TaxID=49252 RepID=A0A7S2R6B1_9STRA|mmetsp:Transcript_17629/g.17071  ORF Transcript_17629/g.17071 Transcript_17629/m.17071 type:complete len:148 (+) Transcript_17629:27-470(+)